MFTNSLWHYALKLNKGIYKTTQSVKDEEILKKQSREQANEILSTLSLFCHRKFSLQKSSDPLYGDPTSQTLSVPRRSDLQTFPSAPSPFPGARPVVNAERSTIGGRISQHSPNPAADFYIPEESICLMLVMDKINVLKTFLFLLQEHGLIEAANHEILASACERLHNLVKSELSDNDFFNHPVFKHETISEDPASLPTPNYKLPTTHSSPSSLPTTNYQLPTTHSSPSSPSSPSSLPTPNYQLPNTHSSPSSPSSLPTPNYQLPNTHSSPSSPSSLQTFPSAPENPQSEVKNQQFPEETLSDILENIGKETLSDISDKNLSDTDENLSDTSKNKPIYKAFFGILSAGVGSAFGGKKSNPSPHSAVAVEAEPITAINISGDNLQNSEIETSPTLSVPRRSDFQIFPSAPSQSVIARSDSDEAISPLSVVSGRLSVSLTPRQQKIYGHIAQNGKTQVGDLTALFSEKISEKTVRRDLQILIDNSLISQSGSRRWTYYVAL